MHLYVYISACSELREGSALREVLECLERQWEDGVLLREPLVTHTERGPTAL